MTAAHAIENNEGHLRGSTWLSQACIDGDLALGKDLKADVGECEDLRITGEGHRIANRDGVENVMAEVDESMKVLREVYLHR